MLGGLKYSSASPGTEEVGRDGGGREGAEEELGGRTDCAEGRSAGNVFTDPLNATPDEPELSLRYALLPARELARRDNFDCFGVGSGGAGSCLFDCIIGTTSGGGRDWFSARGVTVRGLANSESATEGAGSNIESSFSAESEGETGIKLGLASLTIVCPDG